MDNFTQSLTHYARLLPARMKLANIGNILQKKDVINGTFTSYNFSMILEGQGFYGWDNQEPIPIKAPCIITQWPETQMHYGPNSGQSWHELYLIYEPDQLQTLNQNGFINSQKRCWPVENISMFRQATTQLLDLVKQFNEVGMADRIDRAAENAVIESLLPAPPILCDADRVVLKIKQQLEAQCQLDHDLNQMARSNGLSPSVFRRQWNKLVGMPPHRYVIERRMIQARKLLAQTAMNISEIAYEVGFADPLYFSRQFRKTTGISASMYRKYFRQP